MLVLNLVRCDGVVGRLQVTLWLVQGSATTNRTHATDESGFLELHLPAPAEVCAIDVEASTDGVRWERPAALRLVPGAIHHERIELPGGSRLTARVINLLGEVVPAIPGLRTRSGGTIVGAAATGFRDTPCVGGEARVASAGIPLHVEAAGIGFVPHTALAWDGDGDAHGDVVVAPASTWRVRVVADETGAPVPGARLGLEPAWTPQPLQEPQGHIAPRCPDWCHVSTGGDGFAETPVGMGLCYRLHVAHPDHPALVIDIDASAWPQELRLARGERIAGIVVDDLGEPIANARVIPLESRLAPTRTDTHGAFCCGSAAPGDRIDFRLEAPGRAPVLRRVSVTAQPIRIELARGLPMSGHVLTADAEPVAHVTLRLTPCDDSLLELRPDATTRTDAEGHFAIDGLAPGRYRAMVDGGAAATAGFVGVAAAGDTDVVFACDQQATLTGLVLDADGLPVRSFQVAVLTDAPGTRRGESRRFHDPTGRFTWSGLPPGPVVVQVEADARRTEARCDLVPNGNDLRVHLGGR